MYLSKKQHDKLRTLVMDFEIPYRSYIARTIVEKYDTNESFKEACLAKASAQKYASIPSLLSKLETIKNKLTHVYDLLKNSNEIIGKKEVENDINIPYVWQLNVLAVLFDDVFSQMIMRFYNAEAFWNQAEHFAYVRNKLSHPGCKTLEKEDLTKVINFFLTMNSFLGNNADYGFYLETRDAINTQINYLANEKFDNPIKINNFTEMPFSDARIVCREKEIEEIKNFVYGKANALRKKNSYCLFGYGGVGKTVLVLEAIKNIVRDIIDDVAVNDYFPEAILFFTAKKEKLSLSTTSGKIEKQDTSYSFSDMEGLKSGILQYLNISSFEGYKGQGLIVIDNYETIDENEKKKINDFIEYDSPIGIQYIITSRQEEPFAERHCLKGFNDEASCLNFLSEYIKENSMVIELSDDDKRKLFEMSKGNTLVLVLCLKRLDLKLDTISGINADLSKGATLQSINKELTNLPANGYEIISEYMFKNTFGDIEKIFASSMNVTYKLLKVLAVYPMASVDIYTLSMLSKESYSVIEPIMAMLCKYMIVEKKENEFRLNEFAAKYIVFRFLPDKESYLELSKEINSSIRQIKSELKNLDEQRKNNLAIDRIMKDWAIDTQGDCIAAAKAYKLFGETQKDCQKGKFFVESAYDEVCKSFEEIERSTMHPYIKYQKARILKNLMETGYLQKEELEEKITTAYQECIWIIKTNQVYTRIKKTKSYASVLWIYGQYLLDKNRLDAIRYLEESNEAFEELRLHDNEYYQCLVDLGESYLSQYEEDRDVTCLRRSKRISDKLWDEKNNYYGRIKNRATNLRNKIKNYMPNVK